jgi:SAM-dependent methyltransferase
LIRSSASVRLHGFDSIQVGQNPVAAMLEDLRFLPSVSAPGGPAERSAAPHFHADARDVAELLALIPPEAKNGRALDVATGGGHAALALAHAGYRTVIGDLSPEMLEKARRLLAAEGCAVEHALFPAEEIPFPRGSFRLVACRVAPHHFHDVPAFIRESHRVLEPGGHLLVIDGCAPDADPETAEWLHRIEKLRDPSHGRLLDRLTWTHLIRDVGFALQHGELQPMPQPDLEWYLEAAGTPAAKRREIRELVRRASPHVRHTMRLRTEGGVVSWTWQRISLLARKRG